MLFRKTNTRDKNSRVLNGHDSSFVEQGEKQFADYPVSGKFCI